MNFRDKLNLQKENGTSYKILFAITVFFIIASVFDPVVSIIRNGFDIDILIFIVSLLVPSLIYGFVILFLEKKRASFSAHLLLFAIFLSNYPRLIFQVGFGTFNLLQFLIVLLGFAASIYVIFKLIAHYNEFNTYGRSIDRVIGIFMILALIRVYFSDSFSDAMMMLVIMFTIILTVKQKEVLPLVGAVYAISIFDDIMSLFLFSNGQTIDFFLSITFSLLVSSYILYRTITLYLDLSKNDYNYVS